MILHYIQRWAAKNAIGSKTFVTGLVSTSSKENQ
jgi:hypothetical protein